MPTSYSTLGQGIVAKTLPGNQQFMKAKRIKGFDPESVSLRTTLPLTSLGAGAGLHTALQCLVHPQTAHLTITATQQSPATWLEANALG